MTDATLTIGKVAEQANLNVPAIRLYERNGLLPEAERVSGKRRFTADTVQRLGIIDVAKQAGFTLEEVGVLLDSIDQGAPAHEQLQALAARKLPEGRCPDRAGADDAELAGDRDRVRLRDVGGVRSVLGRGRRA